MKVITVPCLSDNFAYLLICPHSSEAAVVDPSEAAPVLKALKTHQVDLTCIFNTHHHFDHVGGNEELLHEFPDLQVYAHTTDRGRVPRQTHFLEEGDSVKFGKLSGWITHNPGHTSGAISYVFDKNIFTGDTLFAAGCGRLFEGTAKQMHHSINIQIGRLPEDTRVYFGHEYTEANLRFAQSVDSDNLAIQDKLDRVRTLRAEGKWSTPSSLAEEKLTNPFLRCKTRGIMKTVRERIPQSPLDEASVFEVIRKMKDQF